MPMVSTPNIMPFVPQCELGLMWWNVCSVEKKTRWCLDLVWYAGTIWKYRVAAPQLLSETSLKNNGEGKSFTVVIMSGNAPGCTFCLCPVYQIMGSSQWFGWMIRVFERTWLENWWQRHHMCTEPYKWIKYVKIFVYHVNAYQKMTSAEKNFNIKVDSVILCAEYSQPLFPAIPVISP